VPCPDNARITKLAYAYWRADQSPSQAVPVSISQGLLLAFDDFFVQLACHGGFFSAGLEARQWWTGWECFWAGRGKRCPALHGLLRLPGRWSPWLWATWLTAYYFRAFLSAACNM